MKPLAVLLLVLLLATTSASALCIYYADPIDDSVTPTTMPEVARLTEYATAPVRPWYMRALDFFWRPLPKPKPISAACR